MRFIFKLRLKVRILKWLYSTMYTYTYQNTTLLKWSCNTINIKVRSGYRAGQNNHYFKLFNIILSQISPEIIPIIRDPSKLSRIMTKPSRIRIFLLKWLFFIKLHPFKVSVGYFLTSPVWAKNDRQMWVLFTHLISYFPK